MAELAWPADLGHGTFTGRFGFMDADGPDPDREPDIVSATGGTVTITPSIKSVRYTGADGPIVLVARPAQGIIDREGYLCSADGTRGMVFPATDDADLTPTDWTYEVSVVLDGRIRLGAFNVKLPEGETVDLSLAVPVPASGGTAVVVDPSTATRAEAAAMRAEAAADAAEEWTPTFEWDGTYLVVDGVRSPNLKGEKGSNAWADITGKPTSYPSTVADVSGIVVDTSVGTRVRIGGHLVHASTGRRNVTSLFSAGLDPENTGAIYMSRQDGRAIVEFSGVKLAAGTGTIVWPSVLPSGFTPIRSGAYTAVTRGNSFTALQVFGVNGSAMYWLSELSPASSVSSTTTRPTATITGQIEYSATGWPATLPGTPA